MVDDVLIVSIVSLVVSLAALAAGGCALLGEQSDGLRTGETVVVHTIGPEARSIRGTVITDGDVLELGDAVLFADDGREVPLTGRCTLVRDNVLFLQILYPSAGG